MSRRNYYQLRQLFQIFTSSFSRHRKRVPPRSVSPKTRLWSLSHYEAFKWRPPHCSFPPPRKGAAGKGLEGWDGSVRQGDREGEIGTRFRIYAIACAEKRREFLSLGFRKIGTRPTWYVTRALPITACDPTNRKALGQITCRVGRRFPTRGGTHRPHHPPPSFLLPSALFRQFSRFFFFPFSFLPNGEGRMVVSLFSPLFNSRLQA